MHVSVILSIISLLVQQLKLLAFWARNPMVVGTVQTQIRKKKSTQRKTKCFCEKYTV